MNRVEKGEGALVAQKVLKFMKLVLKSSESASARLVNASYDR